MKDLQVLDLNIWKQEFPEDICNYDKVQEYLDFIKEAVERYDSERYSEWHHVMPRCVDKEGKYLDQGLRVNGADHFRAHRILVDCFNGKFKCKMSFTLTKLLGHLSSHITPEEYEEARRLNSEALKGNKYAEGHVHDEVARKKMSEHHRLTDTEETKKKRSDSLLGHEISEDVRSQISETLLDYFNKNREETGRPLLQTTYDKIHESLIKYYQNHHVSEETRKKHSESSSGEKNGMYGKHHTPEARTKMSESRQGNQYAKGNIWITDGVNNKIIRNPEDLPEGWRFGRTIPRRKKVV